MRHYDFYLIKEELKRDNQLYQMTLFKGRNYKGYVLLMYKAAYFYIPFHKYSIK